MSENNDLKDCLRALAEAMPRDASPSLEQRLLVRFRQQRSNKGRRIYLASVAAFVAIAIGLYVAQWRNRNAARPVSPAEDQAFGFIALPYAESGVPMEQPVIVRVNIPVSELVTVGVPFTPTSARERVRADLLVGQDGVARAVRFVQ